MQFWIAQCPCPLLLHSTNMYQSKIRKFHFWIIYFDEGNKMYFKCSYIAIFPQYFIKFFSLKKTRHFSFFISNILNWLDFYGHNVIKLYSLIFNKLKVRIDNKSKATKIDKAQVVICFGEINTQHAITQQRKSAPKGMASQHLRAFERIKWFWFIPN